MRCARRVRGKTSQRERWLFAAELEKLSLALHGLADVAINGAEFLKCSHSVADEAAELTQRAETAPVWERVRAQLAGVLRELCKVNDEVLSEASDVRKHVIGGIVEKLSGDRNSCEALGKFCTQIEYEYVRPDHLEEYWKDLRDAAAEADRQIQKLLAALSVGSYACSLLGDVAIPDAKATRAALKKLAETNERVARRLSRLIEPNIEWMRQAMTREVAYASAGDSTFFDAAELLGAVVAVERWGKASKIEIAMLLPRW